MEAEVVPDYVGGADGVAGAVSTLLEKSILLRPLRHPLTCPPCEQKFICVAGMYVTVRAIVEAYASGEIAKPFAC